MEVDRSNPWTGLDTVLYEGAMSETLRTPAFLESVLDAVDDPLYVIRVADYSIVLANRAAREMGVEHAQTCFAFSHHRDTPCEGDEHPCPLQQVLRLRKPCVVEHLHYRPDGTPYYAEVRGYPLYNEKGEVEHMVEYTVDITARKSAEERLRLLERAVEFSGSGVVITNVKGEIEYVNPAFSRMTGYSAEEVLGKTPRILKSGKHPPEFYADLWQTILRGEVWRGEMTNRKKDGSLYWEQQTIAPVRDGRGRITHFVAVKEDVTERKRTEQELKRLATTDPLTGLFNRRHFFRHAEVLFRQANLLSAPLSVVMVDLDHFKSINDRYGHGVGDEVLREAAARLRRVLRADDLIARYGGEEFALLLPRTPCAAALQVAERLRRALSDRPIPTSAGELSVTASFGVACLDETVDSLDTLLLHADQALYAAKGAGRNCCVVYRKV